MGLKTDIASVRNKIAQWIIENPNKLISADKVKTIFEDTVNINEGLLNDKDVIRVDYLIDSNVTFTSLVNGASVDGITLVSGMVILLSQQTTKSENGVWEIQDSGTANRHDNYSTTEQQNTILIRVQNIRTGQYDTFYRSTLTGTDIDISNMIEDLLLLYQGTSFGGKIEPSSPAPTTGSNPIFWLCDGNGTYTNFGSQTISEDIGWILWDGSNWDKVETTVTLATYQKKVSDGDLDMNSYKIANILSAENEGEAVEYKQFKKHSVDKKAGKNKFDASQGVEDGKYINTSSYEIASAADYGISKYIEVEESIEYYLTNPSYTNCAMIFYDIDKVKISGQSGANFITPANCKYIIITVYNSTTKPTFDINTIQLEKGSIATEYEAYWQYIDENIASSKLVDDARVLLVDEELWKVRGKDVPQNENRIQIKNAISQYGVDEDVELGGQFQFSSHANENSTMKRIYDATLYDALKRVSKLRIHHIVDSSMSQYYPRTFIRLSLEDLKKIGIDITETGYTFKKINLRSAVENYIGWTSHQLWITLCYTKYPEEYIDYASDNVTYVWGTGTEKDPLNGDIATDNPSLEFTIGVRSETHSTGNYRYFDDVRLHKEIEIEGSTQEFKGIIIQILGGGSGSSERGYDLHSLAVVNNDIVDVLGATTDVRNIPDDVQFTFDKIEDLANVKNKSASNGQILRYDGDRWEAQDLEGLTGIANVQNSDKIAFFGCSYTESYYTLKNKSWVNKVSQMTDWIVANFGVSGNRIVDEIERMRLNENPFHSTIGIEELNPTIISIANIGNENVDDLANLDLYRQEFKYAAQHIKSIGAEMLIGTDHFADRSDEMLLYALGKEFGINVFNIGQVGKTVLSTDYAGFWGGGHPATRTNSHTFLEWMYFISQLPRPRKAVKLFRVRGEYKGGTILYSDLNYDTIQQRLRYFQEINSGEKALTETGTSKWEYYDRLNESYGGEVITNEYAQLINNEAISFENFALIEFVIDKLKIDNSSITIDTDVQPTNIYIANNNAPTTRYDSNKYGAAFNVTKTVYNAFTETIGEEFTSDATGGATLTYTGKVKGGIYNGYWLIFNSTALATSGGSGELTKTADSSTTAYTLADSKLGRQKIEFFEKVEQAWSRWETISFTYVDGKVTIEPTSLYHYQYDKVRILIEKSGSFTVANPEITYFGGVIKEQFFIPKFENKKTFKELNTYQGFDTDWESTGGWTNNGASLVEIPASVRDYPPLHTVNKHIELGYDGTNGFSTSISKTFTLTQTARGLVKVVIRVIARLYPKIYNSSVAEDDYHTQTRQIKPDSYDMGTLVCILRNGETEGAVIKKPVDIGWSEVYFETYLPVMKSSSFEVSLYRDEFDKIDEVNYRNHTYPMQVYDVSVQIENE